MGIVCGSPKKPPEPLEMQQNLETQGELRDIPEHKLDVVERKRMFSRQWSGIIQNSDLIDITSNWSSATSKIDITSEYYLMEVIGEGLSSTVYKAHPKSNPDTFFAIKCQKRYPKSERQHRYFKSELDILKELDHSNIVRFFESYEDDKKNYLVLEYCEGPNLVDVVDLYNGIPDCLAKKFFYQAVYAVHYIHHAGIVHRDLKLDNFLLKSKDHTNSDIKLIDFGFARNFKRFDLTTRVGTPWYIAPELFWTHHKYDHRCDNWSLGVLLHMMVFRRAPFLGRSNAEIITSIQKTELDFTSDLYTSANPAVVDLLKGLLQKDPLKRLNLDIVLQSPWFNSHILELHTGWTPEAIQSILTRASCSQGKSGLVNEIYRILVKLVDAENPPEVQTLKKQFRCLDILSNGVITPVELCYTLKEGSETSKEQVDVKSVVDAFYLQTQGVITLSEFLVAALPKSLLTNVPRLKMLYDKFDVSKAGKVTAKDMQTAFQRFGYALTPAFAQSFVKNFDTYQDGAVSFEEFRLKMVEGESEVQHPYLLAAQPPQTDSEYQLTHV